MPAPLPPLDLEKLGRGLARLSPEPLPPAAVKALWEHYQELGRWNRSLSLVGPGTAGEVLSRHYGESLAALPLIPPQAREAVDIGSGAGFPGLVLAAVRPETRFTLVEARERKWAFLLAACRRASLPCRCLNARVAFPLPAGLPDTIDLVTVRALKLDPELLGALAGRLGPAGRILLWAGGDDPELPPELEIVRDLRLAGSERRRIVAVAPRNPAASQLGKDEAG